jgi:para-nitrobenzyl esterase
MTIVQTKAGRVQGIRAQGVEIFLGVRYAMAPTGAQRFCAPEEARRWDGLADATRHAHRAVQGEPFCPELLGTMGPGTISEDCLFLNLFTPHADAGRRPVLVWIHGGGLIAGSANDFDGANLAAAGDVVIVCINYRLGFFGFLDLSAYGDHFQGSASNGYRDQIAAMVWVRDNIAAFGGDPGNVTIFGQSAGGGSVRALMAAPSADGLYHKAIIMSPGSPTGPPPDYSDYLKSELGADDAHLIERLYALSAEQLLDLQSRSAFVGSGSIDGIVITRSTAQAIRERGCVPLIAGTTRNEGAMMNAVLEDVMEASARAPDSPMMENIASMIMRGGDGQAYCERLRAAHPAADEAKLSELIWTDLMRQQAIEVAESASRCGADAWLYRFDIASPIRHGTLGATHIVDVPFVFNNFEWAVPPISRQDLHNETVQRIGAIWSQALARFARTGDPNGPGLPCWPRYSPTDRRCLIIDAAPHIEIDPDKAHRALWREDAERVEGVA